MPRSPFSRTSAVCGVAAAAAILTVALACSDAFGPRTPRGGSASPRFVYQDPALESPPSVSGSISLPERATSVGAMSTLVGHFPYGTVVRFEVSGSHVLSSVTGADGGGSYGLQGRSCQTGEVGTTSFGGATTSWGGCNAPISNTRTDYSDYIAVSGDVYLYHAGDGGDTPPYPDCTHDCFYIGGGSQLTLTRVEASLDLTTTDAPAQSAGVYIVKPGTSLTFGWTVSPASVSSVGGTIKLGAVTNDSSWEITRPGGWVVPCPYLVYAPYNYRYCQVRADSALTVKLTAITNGAWKSKSIQVIPKRNFRLQGPGSAQVGDTGTYSATLDGQAVRATRWVWVPNDTSTHDVSSGWDDSASTNRRKSMVTSGKMTAYIDYVGGGTDSASITTVVRDKFTLTASLSTVSYGDTVTFTPLLNGTPTVASRWKYVPTDTSSRDSTACAGQTSVCVKRMQRSGTMLAWLASDSTRSATAYVTVDAGCVPGPTFSKAGTSAMTPGGATISAPRSTMRARPSHSPVASRDVICGGDGGSGLGTGSDSTRRFIVRQNLQLGVVSSIPVSDSLYRAGDTLHYHFTAALGFEEPAVFLDSVSALDSGTFVVTGDHEFEVGTDSDYAARPDLQELASRIRTLVWAADPPAAYADFVRWYSGASAADSDLDRKLSVASVLAMGISADSDSVAAYERAAFDFDSAMAGAYFTIDGSQVNPIVTLQRPSDYTPSTADRIGPSLRLQRAPGRPSADLAPTRRGTTVVYVNGMLTPHDRFNASWVKLSSVVKGLSWADSTRTGFLWNRNYPNQFQGTVYRAGCADYALARFRATHNWFMTLAKWEVCLRLRVAGRLAFNDLVEAMQQEWQVYGGSAAKADDAIKLAYKIAALHGDSAQNVILVTHSQGNLMAAQAYQILPSLPNGVLPGRCTEELSLASPIDHAGFTELAPNLASPDLDGLTMEYDILKQVGLPNDFAAEHSTLEPTALDSAYAALWRGGPIAMKYVLFSWGVQIHDVDRNYFSVDPGLGVLKSKLNQLYIQCPL